MPENPVTPNDTNTNINTNANTGFSLEYVQELRGESAAYRTKAKEAEGRALQAQQQAEAKIAEAQRAAEARIIRAELKTEAQKLGLLDADDLKLADLSQVSVNEQGDVVGAVELIQALKQAKPYLFGRAASTSQTAPPPVNTASKPFHAKDATPEELAADAKARGLNIKLR